MKRRAPVVYVGTVVGRYGETPAEAIARYRRTSVPVWARVIQQSMGREAALLAAEEDRADAAANRVAAAFPQSQGSQEP